MSSIGRRGDRRIVTTPLAFSNESNISGLAEVIEPEPQPYALFYYRLAPDHPTGKLRAADEYKWHKFGSDVVYSKPDYILKGHGSDVLARLTNLPGPCNPNFKDIEKALHIVILACRRFTQAELNIIIKDRQDEYDKWENIQACKVICKALLVVCSIAFCIAFPLFW